MIVMFWPYMPVEKVEKAIRRVLESRWIGQGPRVDEVEKKFEKMFNVPYAITVNSCTAALHLSLILAGVGKGDEVVTTPMTCSATNIPILYCRARPVFADIQEDTLNIDPSSIREKITKKTKAILVVHWAGYPCDMGEIMSIAKEYKLKVIEDAAHALGAKYHGLPIGGLGNFTCFSFQAIKQITCGDGGVLTVLDREDYEKARLLRWYGIDRTFKGDIYWKYQIKEPGFKYHMNDINATILSVQLDELSTVLKRRREIARLYQENLADVPGLTLLKREKDRESGSWLFTVLVEKRENFIKKLRENGIESHMVHVRCDIYPIFGGRRLDLPTMNKVESKYVSIPLHNKLSDEDVNKIIKTISNGW